MADAMRRNLVLGAALVAALPALCWAGHACLSADYRLVALTFDDGPSPRYTEQVLRVLDEERVRATFLFMGENAERLPAIASDAARRGHEVGSHTYAHHSLVHLSKRAVSVEIDRGRTAVQKAAGVDVRVFRAPYGQEPPFLHDTCRKLGIAVVPFGVTGYDWEKRTAREIADTVLNAVKPGDFILLHDGSNEPGGDRSQTVAAVHLIVPALERRGFRFVTASELLAARHKPGFAVHDLARRAWTKLARTVQRGGSGLELPSRSD